MIKVRSIGKSHVHCWNLAQYDIDRSDFPNFIYGTKQNHL